jgi:hypothetical protein
LGGGILLTAAATLIGNGRAATAIAERRSETKGVAAVAGRLRAKDCLA